MDFLTWMSASFDGPPTDEQIEIATEYFASLHGTDVIGNWKLTLVYAEHRRPTTKPKVWTGPRHNVSVLQGDKTTHPNGDGMHRFFEFKDSGDLHASPGTDTKKKWRKRDPAKTLARIKANRDRKRDMGTIEWMRLCLVAENYTSFNNARQNGAPLIPRRHYNKLLGSWSTTIENDYHHCLQVKGDWNLVVGKGGTFLLLCHSCECVQIDSDFCGSLFLFISSFLVLFFLGVCFCF